MAELRTHLRRATKFFVLVLAAVFGVGLVGSWSVGAGLLLFVVGMPVLAIRLLVGAAILGWRGFKLSREAARPRIAFVVPLMLLLTVAVSWPALAAGSYSVTWVRLMLNWSHYKSIIEKAQRGEHHPKQGSAYEEDGGVRYVVDAGPPVRVAFNPEGFLDNWSGIVFDPTHDVLLANGFDKEGKFAAPDRVTKLFAAIWSAVVGLRAISSTAHLRD